MKQPEDQQTLELALVEPRRGRGRPAKADALTQAERSKRYRDAKRASLSDAPIMRDAKVVTVNEWLPADQVDLIGRLRTQLDLASAERDAAMKEVIRSSNVTAILTNDVYKLTNLTVTLSDVAAKLEDELHSATVAGSCSQDWGNEVADRNIALQKKFDLEHLALVEAQNRIAALEADVAKPPKVNPLAAEVRKLKQALKERDLQHALIVRTMRDEFNVTATSQAEAPKTVKAEKPRTNRNR